MIASCLAAGFHAGVDARTEAVVLDALGAALQTVRHAQGGTGRDVTVRAQTDRLSLRDGS